MQPLTDQVAVVTGGARGIGRGIAAVLAAEGARVVIADVDGAEARRVAGELAEGGRLAVPTDVTDRASVDALAAAALAAYGRIDILAANAGIYPSTELAAIDDALWDRVMDINVKGALHAVQACTPAMLARGYGRIVLTSSITGPITGQVGFAHYGASKAAMLGLMRSAAVELATSGVTVNAVMPGNIETPGLAETSEEHQRLMFSSIPMGRFGTAEEVGWAVRFLASPEAGYVTGQTLIVDGGQVLPEAPTYLDVRPDQVVAVVVAVAELLRRTAGDLALVVRRPVGDALAIEVDAEAGARRHGEERAVELERAAEDDVVGQVGVVGLVVEHEVAVRGVQLEHQRRPDPGLAERVRHDRQPRRLGDLRGRPRAGDARVEARIELQGVGASAADHGERPLEREARLVRQDRHRGARAQPRHLGRIACRQRLLGVLDAVAAEALQHAQRERRRPRRVGVDADARAVSDRGAHGAHARLVDVRARSRP